MKKIVVGVNKKNIYGALLLNTRYFLFYIFFVTLAEIRSFLLHTAFYVINPLSCSFYGKKATLEQAIQKLALFFSFLN